MLKIFLITMLHYRYLRLLLVYLLTILVGLTTSPFARGQWVQPVLPLPTNDNPAMQIRFKDAAGADAHRQRLIRWIWPDGLPSSKMPTVSQGIAFPQELAGIERQYVAKVDRLDANIFGMHSVAYYIHPVKGDHRDRLFILHEGHTPSADWALSYGIGSTTNRLLGNGFSVIVMQMPMNGWNPTPARVTLPGNAPIQIEGTATKAHNDMFTKLTPLLPEGAMLQFYLEPVVQFINYAHSEASRPKDISMTGVSGGGWTTTMAAAVDKRIKLSIPVAGSGPFYSYNRGRWIVGDAEQSYIPLFREDIAADGSGGGIATYLECYVLGGYGPGRRQIKITNRDDSCCFKGNFADSFKDIVSNFVKNQLRTGRWEHVLDITHQQHEISPWAWDHVIWPALCEESK